MKHHLLNETTGRVRRGKEDVGLQKRTDATKKASRYPPIYDQIDTPADFSMAATEKGGRGERWQQVTERRS